MCKIAALGLLSILIWTPRAQAQQPANKDTSAAQFKGGAEEVLLDVVVRDKKGHPVRDLTAKDFDVLDNGQHREIKSLRLVEGGEAVDAGTGARKQLDPMQQIRLVTLIFHGLDQNGRILARQAALELTKSELGQNVFMSVLTVDHTLEAVQRFTNDRALLKKAIERATSGAHDYADDTSNTLQQLQQMAGPVQGGLPTIENQVSGMSSGAGGTSGASAAPQGGAAADAAMAQIMLGMLHSSQQDATSDWGRTTIYALLDAVKEQFRMPGRKTILLFSSGFAIPQSAQDQFNSIISLANRSNVSFYSIDTHGLATSSTASGAVSELGNASSASAKNATVRNGVSMDMARATDYAIDAGHSDTQLNLEILAKQTGGELIANTNDFRGPIKKLEEDIETYYEISYAADIQKYDGSFRKVSIKVDEPNVKVQAPAGYFALPPSMTTHGEALAPFEVPLLQALEQRPLPHDFAFHSAGLHYQNGQETPTCDVVLDVPISNLTLQKMGDAGPYEGKFAYVVLIKDPEGNLLKKFRSEIPLAMTADKIDAYKAGHFVYSEPFALKSGRYILETAVMDITGNKISARKASFIVPAPGVPLSISSIAIVRNVKPAEQGANPADPLIMGQQAITPSLSPSLKKSEATAVPFYVVVYADKSSSQSPTLEMEFEKDGQVLGRIPAQLGKPDAEGRIQYMVTAPIDKLTAGDYQVRFIAKQGAQAAIESTTFDIEP